MSLMDKLLKSGSIKSSSILSESVFFNQKDVIPTPLPILNIAFSGSLDGGLTPGLTVLAGPSKSFKTLLGLYCMKAYMDKYPDSVALVFDSEFGITPDYLKSNNIDTDKVIHIPIEHIEQLKFDIVKRLESVERGDKVFIMIDSLGALSSKKEVEDAMDEKSVADMTRAKSIRSLFRIITPHLTMKDLPCVVINHTYSTMELYSKQVVGGGTSVTYSANQIFIIGRQQEKDGTELAGYNFILNVEKSRFVKEKSKLPFTVKFEGGIQKYSGVLDVAMEGKFVVKPSNGWYAKVDSETGEIGDKVRFSATQTPEFMESILNNDKFKEYVKQRYGIAYGSIMGQTPVLEEETNS